MKNKIIIALIVISVLLVFAIPLIIDWLIIGNSITSNISNSDWVSFLGGYVGAIIGALVSLGGIVATIKFTATQSQKDREEQIKPYCVIRYIQNYRSDDKEVKSLGQVYLEFVQNKSPHPSYIFYIFIRNVGLGPAVNFDFSLKKIDAGRKFYKTINKRLPYSSHEVDSLQSGEEGLISFCIDACLDPIDKENIIEESPGNYSLKTCVEEKYKDFDIIINISYEDMYHNKFSQKITLHTEVEIILSVDYGTAEYAYRFSLKDVTPPTKCNNKLSR